MATTLSLCGPHRCLFPFVSHVNTNTSISSLKSVGETRISLFFLSSFIHQVPPLIQSLCERIGVSLIFDGGVDLVEALLIGKTPRMEGCGGSAVHSVSLQ